MNLQTQKLFETQKILDDKIVKEKGLEGVDLLDKKILALQVELGELANEWRGFKFWSKKNRPVTWRYEGQGFSRNPLLEEYVDCLHFILSIGNDLGLGVPSVSSIKTRVAFKGDEVTIQFNALFKNVGDLGNDTSRNDITGLCYRNTLYNFVGLGEMLGFTWEQIEQAYYDKNKVNHERQNNGY